MNAVIYARYSSDKQTEQSIEGQLRSCYEYAERQNITIVGEYIDRAITGKYDDRPQFQKMITDSAKKQFDYVLVYKLDRFARNRYDSAIYKHKLKKNNVRVLSAMENIGDNPESILLEALLEASAEYYSVELAQKVRRGMRESALKANSTGGTIPLGYKLENKKLVIDDKTAPVVEYIFKEYAKGTGKKDIAAELTRHGYRNKQGKEFQITSFRQVLSNKKYLGIYKYNDIEIEGGCPAIIDIETFNKCQLITEKTKRAPAAAKAKVKYLLQGKLFCGMCGTHMVGESGHNKSKVYNYYSCSKRKKEHACNKKNEKKDFLEWYIVEQTLEYVLTPGRMEYIADRIVQEYDNEFNNNNIVELERRIAKIDREMNECVDTLLGTKIKTIINKINERAECLEAQKTDLEINLSKLKIANKIRFKKDDIIIWLKQFCEGDLMDDDFRQRIIDVFINSIYLFDDKVIIYYNIKDSKQISYIDMLKSSELEDLEPECSNLMSDGSPNRNTVICKDCGVFCFLLFGQKGLFKSNISHSIGQISIKKESRFEVHPKRQTIVLDG